MIRIDADSYLILGQKYGLPSQKCGMSVAGSYLLGLMTTSVVGPYIGRADDDVFSVSLTTLSLVLTRRALGQWIGTPV